VPVFGYKVLAFTIGCLFAGLAGAFYAHFVTYISADQFSVNESFLILTMVAIGGTGSIVGPIIGALILIVVPEVFRFLAQYRTVFYGLLLIVVMVVKPEGIAGVKAIFMRAPGSIGFSLRRKKSAGGNRAPEGTA
jgi:branched-chain amino acid transport system permease protein